MKRHGETRYVHTRHMKRRRRKHFVRREMRDAVRAEKRERGDHRRWSWIAASPWREHSGVLGPCTVRFDPKMGRLYTPDSLLPREVQS